jgi:hypothetical protein
MNDTRAVPRRNFSASDARTDEGSVAETSHRDTEKETFLCISVALPWDLGFGLWDLGFSLS